MSLDLVRKAEKEKTAAEVATDSPATTATAGTVKLTNTPGYTLGHLGTTFTTTSGSKTNTGLSITVPSTGTFMLHMKAEATNGQNILRNQTAAFELLLSPKDYIGTVHTWIVNRPFNLTAGDVLEFQLWKSGGSSNISLLAGSTLELVKMPFIDLD